jgi:hypothetical protein
MSWLRPSLAVALVSGLCGCDPIFTTHLQQGSVIAPTPSCASAALASVPEVAAVTPTPVGKSEPGRESLTLTLRDSTLVWTHWSVTLMRPAPPDTLSRFEVAYSYWGVPQTSTRLHLLSLAERLLATVRASCAPTSASPVRCRSTGGFGGQHGACRGAA